MKLIPFPTFLFLLFFNVAQASTAGEELSVKTTSAFLWVIGIAALIAGVSFVIGAVQYLFSMGSDAIKKDARSRMIASIFGLIICLASMLILNQINPEIAKLNFGEPIGKKFPGIYYSNGNPKEDIPAPMANADITNAAEIKNLGYTQIVYYCGQSYQEPLLVTFYPQKNFKDKDPSYKNTTVKILTCKENTAEEIDKGILDGESIAIQGLSFEMAFQGEGVYFFLNDDCNGYRKLFTANVSPIPQPFYGNIKSVEILGPMIHFQNRALGKWGVIFHDNNDTWRADRCMTPVVALPNNKCFNTPGPFHSATIFYQEAKLGQTLNSTGANFYSKPWGWQTGSFAGYNNKTITTNDNDAAVKSKLFVRPANLTFNYLSCTEYGEGNTTSNRCETQAYKNMCSTFEKCPGSIKLSGKYLMILSTDPDYGTSYYNSQASFRGSQCQIFYSSINSIKELEFTGKGNTIRSINLIPIK